ncbi:hypothetical protein ACU686_11435 [Yinghuangia aomiensis]
MRINSDQHVRGLRQQGRTVPPRGGPVRPRQTLACPRRPHPTHRLRRHRGLPTGQRGRALTRADLPARMPVRAAAPSPKAVTTAISPGSLAESRLAGERAPADRTSPGALAEGDLPAGTDPPALARHVMVVSEGNAVHAAAGAGRTALHATVDIALHAVPGRDGDEPGPA